MKTKSSILLFLLALLLGVSLASAQNFAIDWFTIGGGGGVSTGDVYSVSGTIGQPHAGTLSGGNFTLHGGFWSVLAVQSPGAPFLSVRLSATNTVLVSWPTPATGFELQQNPDLTTTNWTNVGLTPADVGADKQVILAPPVGHRFFRLRKP